MIVFGKRRPPAFRHHVAMADDHDAVKFLPAGFDGGEEVQDGSRGDALLFGGAARKGAGAAGGGVAGEGALGGDARESAIGGGWGKGTEAREDQQTCGIQSKLP